MKSMKFYVLRSSPTLSSTGQYTLSSDMKREVWKDCRNSGGNMRFADTDGETSILKW